MVRTALITDETKIRELRAAWRCTEAPGASSIFTSPEWCYAAWRFLPELGFPRLLVAYDDAEDVQAVLPLSATSDGLRFAGSPLGDEHDLRVRPGILSALTAQRVLAELETCARTEENVRLRNIRAHGALAHAASTRQGCPAPVLRLDSSVTGVGGQRRCPGGSRRRRKALANRRRALGRLGKVTRDRVVDPDRLHDTVGRFVADRLGAWRQRGRLHELPTADRHPASAEFLSTVAAALARRGQCFLTRLHLDGRALAQALYFRDGCTDLMYMTTYEPEYARYSPSHLLFIESAATAAREGITTIELGRGDEQYKLDLGAELSYLREVIL